MAKDPLAPGGSSANPPCCVPSTDAMLPLAALPVPERPEQLDAEAWQTAYIHYACAATRYEGFIQDQYRPACARMEEELDAQSNPDEVRSALFAKYQIQALEEQGNDLRGVQMDHMRTLITTPAPDLQAFSTKLEIAYRDIFFDEPDYNDVVAELVADARRLI